MDLNTIFNLVNEDFEQVNHTIDQCLESNIPVISKIINYIISSGGKRIRPLLVLLSAKASGYKGQAHVTMAAVIEFIHTATLLHDDVVDDSKMRRNQPTANSVWGNPYSILIGDFLYSRAFQMMVSIENMAIMKVLSAATNVISEGEVVQLVYKNNSKISEDKYRQIIQGKTAKLFEVSSQLGPLLCGHSHQAGQRMADFGLHLGTAFQLVDDVLDYRAPKETLGKNIGDDLAEGKVTLPLIYALKHGNASQGQIIEEAIKQGGLEHLEAIQAAIHETGAIEYTMAQAQNEVSKAKDMLNSLSPSPYKEALGDLAEFALQRVQ